MKHMLQFTHQCDRYRRLLVSMVKMKDNLTTVQAADFLDDSDTLQRAGHDLAALVYPVIQAGSSGEQGGQGVGGSSTTQDTLYVRFLQLLNQA